MQRRKFIRNTLGFGIAAHPLVRAFGSVNAGLPGQVYRPAGPRAPLTIYNNWSSYDELSDNIPLTEALAMKELDELLRWKKNGVQVDYYVMDAFWFDKSGGYRTWHKQHWPNGPDAWLKTCRDNNIKPGMWFSTNLLGFGNSAFLEAIPEWKDSLSTDGGTLCLFSGGYLRHLAATLQMWAGKGVQCFKFDFAYFNAATAQAKQVHLPAEIEEMNKLAFMDMLKQFRLKNPDALILGYNGFGGEMENTYTPFSKTVDIRWLEVFDTLYCGDPRFSDVPVMNIWRSADLYSDHMVRQFEMNGLPLRRIDNCAFMIGKTGTCYKRADNAWKGMLILELARGGWVNVYHGNLELLTNSDVQWFAKAQQLFHTLQQFAMISTFGEIPGTGRPYGYYAQAESGAVCTVVNPSQAITEVALPASSSSSGNIIYADSGFTPVLKGNRLTLGAEQLVVVGLDEYAHEKYALGTDDAIRIPLFIRELDSSFAATGKNEISATVQPVAGKVLRIIFQQFGSDGFPRRSWGGAPPDGKKMDTFLKIVAMQGNKTLPIHIEYDKMIWSGLSWAAGEIKSGDIAAGQPVTLRCTSTEPDKLHLKAHVYTVSY